MPEPQRPDDGAAHDNAAASGCADEAQARFALGNALWPTGQRDEAVAAYIQAVALDPEFVDGRNNLGNALCALDRHEEAIVQYRAALALRPGSAELHYNLANALVATGALELAEAEFAAAIAARPEHAGAHNNLGNCLRAQGRHQDAIASYASALELRPDFFGSLNNIGSALLALHRPMEAEEYFRRCLQQRPDYAEACNNLGGALLALDQPEQAVTWFRRAYTLDPGQSQAHFGEALALLVQGDFPAGWRAYEWRWLDPRFCEGEPEFTAPIWLGEDDIAGRCILLHAEQGLGDSIQFVRYAKLLRARGARVVLSVQPPLAELFAELADEVVAQGGAFPAHDRHCPLLSLPLAFATDLAGIPAEVPYLRAAPARVAEWAGILGPRRALRVGVAWSGSPEHPDDAIRSIAPHIMLPPLMATGAELHAVQKDLRAEDHAALAGISVHADRLGDFAATAGLIACLDLVITVDTSVAHLAGAMGVPTWVLLQSSNDFRWLRGRADSPWYPSMRLFRQRQGEDWHAVLATVAAELRRLV